MTFRSAGSTTDTGPMGPVSVLAMAVLLCLSPLMRGGNRQIAMVVLEAIALLFFLSAGLRWSMRGDGGSHPAREPWHKKLMLTLLVASPAWLALVYLLPLPFWSGLHGRAIYGTLLAGAAIPVAQSLPLSLVPDATEASLLMGIPIAAAFMAAYAARLSQLKLLLAVAAGMAFMQVLLGLLQAGGGSQSTLYFSVEFGGRPVGTFANTNHFANYIGMAVAGYIWLAWNSVAVARSGPADSEQRFGQRHALAFWIAGGFVLILGIVMSFSRGAALSGLPAALLAVAVAYVAGGRTTNWRIPLLLMIAAVVAAIVLVGAGALMSRFDLAKLTADASFRSLLASSTLAGAREFWPWGAGWGTYGSVYPRFQPIAVDGHADHAHQDYAQLLFEGGLFAVLLCLVFLVLAIGRAIHLARQVIGRGALEPGELVAALCGVGLLGFLVHSLVEFNMHIPANAILAALLAGAFLRPLPARGGPR